MSNKPTEENRISFNFTYYAMKLLGKNLYSNPWTAISELVANGIDSGAENVHVLVDMRDKEHAVVEIFDDGHGMSYTDLRDKYTVIGRNKRESDDNISGKTLGRKGIGKLAALYLSPEYFVYTKTAESKSAWKINTLEYKDSDFPAMNQVAYNTEQLIASDIWNRQRMGTMIHLSNVDLRKIGEERLKRLPLSLADYYLDTVINSHIRICVLQKPGEKIHFAEIKKNICFETMYAIFDNTEYGYAKKLLPEVFVTKADVRPEVNYPRKTQVIDTGKFGCEGSIQLTDLQGTVRDIPYKLCGWIGIHCSLDNDVLLRNTSDGKKLRPNSLRLYVRGKLAVDNLMNYIKSSQALANYIEGEISFDVLDDDMFEDASTSSREGYSLSDPRVKVLIDITKKIVRALINERTEIGNKINNELKEVRERELEEERKRKAEAEEQARTETEARHRAEADAQQAREAQQQAETEFEAAKQEVNKFKDQNRILFSTVSEDQESFAAKCHLVKTNAVTIRNSVTTLAKKIDVNTYRELGSIAMASERILGSLKYSALAKFNLRDEFIQEDLFLFCSQFIDNILAKQYHEIEFDIEQVGEVVLLFSPQNVALIFDNLVSNSQKSHSSKVWIQLVHEGRITRITYKDNGTGFAKDEDLERIFQFGWSNTGGTGIGLYSVQRAVERMHGIIKASNNFPVGACFTIDI